MSRKPRVLVVGAGEVGIGTLDALLDKQEYHKDVDIFGLATRRPESVKTSDVHVIGYNEPSDLIKIASWADVAVICNASQKLWYHSEDGRVANEEGVKWAQIFNVTVDSFDGHREMADYFSAMDKATKGLSCSGFGWDPGYFSSHKHAENKGFPRSVTNVFYGPGKSQGHTTGLKTSSFLRDECGLVDAYQVTLPREETMERVRNGEMKEFSAGERLKRDCYIVLRDKSKENLKRASEYIKAMKDYFKGYETNVTLCSQEELDEHNKQKSHQGVVITTARTRKGSLSLMEMKVTFANNAEATGCFLAEAVVAGYKAYQEGRRGAVGPGDLQENLFSYLPRQGTINLGL